MRTNMPLQLPVALVASGRIVLLTTPKAAPAFNARTGAGLPGPAWAATGFRSEVCPIPGCL